MVEKPKNDDDKDSLEAEVKKLKASIIARKGIGEDYSYQTKQLADTLKALGQKEPKKEAKKGRGKEEDSPKEAQDSEKPTREPEKESRFF